MPRNNIEAGASDDSLDSENLPDSAEVKEEQGKIELRRIKDVTDPRHSRSVRKLKPGVTFHSSEPVEEQDGTYFDYDLSPEELKVKDFIEGIAPKTERSLEFNEAEDLLNFNKLGPNQNGECTLSWKTKKYVLDIMLEQGEIGERISKHGRWWKSSPDSNSSMRVGVGQVKRLGKEVWRSGVILDINVDSAQHLSELDDEGDDGYLKDLIEGDMESDAMGEAIEKTIKKAEEVKEKIESQGIGCEIVISADAQNLIEKYRGRKEGEK